MHIREQHGLCVNVSKKPILSRLMHSVSLAGVAAESHNNKSKLHRRCHALLFSNFHLAQFLAFPQRESWYGGRPLAGGTLVFYFFPAKSCARIEELASRRPLGVIIGSFQLQHLFSPLRVLIKSQRMSPLALRSLKSTPLDDARWPSEAVFTSASCFGENAAKYALFCSFVPQKFMRRHCTHAHPLKLFHPLSLPVVWPQFVIIKDSLLPGGASPSRWLNIRVERGWWRWNWLAFFFYQNAVNWVNFL